jgi:hypothetical protein
VSTEPIFRCLGGLSCRLAFAQVDAESGWPSEWRMGLSSIERANGNEDGAAR